MNPILVIALTAAISAPPAAPQPEPPPRATLASQVAALASAPAAPAPAITATRAAMTQPGGDSLKNGALIGGVVAGAAMGGFVYWICRATDDTDGGANCAGPALLWAGIAGAGGAAVGAGVDALFDRPALTSRRSFNVRVRF